MYPKSWCDLSGVYVRQVHINLYRALLPRVHVYYIIITYELDSFNLLQVRSFDVRDLCRCCHFSTNPLRIPWKVGACSSTYRCFIIELFLYEHVYFDCEINTNDMTLKIAIMPVCNTALCVI